MERRNSQTSLEAMSAVCKQGYKAECFKTLFLRSNLAIWKLHSHTKKKKNQTLNNQRLLVKEPK